MQLYNNLNIGLKIGLSFGFVGILFIAVLWQYHSTLNNTQSSYEDLLSHSEAKKSYSLHMGMAMLQARRAEKDFLARKTLDYVDKNTTFVAEMLSNLAAIEKIDQTQKHKTKSTATTRAYIQTYQQAFQAIVMAWQKKGLDHQSGLQGQFRQAAHQLESRLDKHDATNIMVDYLLLRRYEKDYLLRNLLKYTQKVDQSIEKIQKAVNTSLITPADKTSIHILLKTYQRTFHKLVAQNEHITELMANMRAAVHQVEPIINDNIQQANGNMAQIVTNTQIYAENQAYKALLISLFAAVLGVVFAFIIVKSITRPVKNVLKFTKHYGQGELNAVLNIDSKDELGSMMGSLQTAITKLKKIILNVKTSANNVSSGSQQLSASAQQVAKGATEQAASVEETAASMEEMMVNIQQNAENALQTAQTAKKAAEDISRSSIDVSQAMQAMKQIADKISVIDEIAQQTNLLALNAAIEAARAGEYGAGFAVVASEVKKLAEHSRAAAGEIMQLSTDNIKIAETANTSLESLVPDIQKTAELVEEISANTEEQNTGAEQINQALQQLDKVIQQNASTSEQIASTAEELSAQAQGLQHSIAFFKTGS